MEDIANRQKPETVHSLAGFAHTPISLRMHSQRSPKIQGARPALDTEISVSPEQGWEAVSIRRVGFYIRPNLTESGADNIVQIFKLQARILMSCIYQRMMRL